ncbi:MAG: helix-turn-helix domain-containing protein [Burkholderiales bacterium]|nr:helix-turn-helix domain-containing protein [Burkholderiales bacterium]
MKDLKERVSTVMGRFGRLSAGAFTRPVNSHAYREPSVVFHLGGGELVASIDGRSVPFKPGDMLLIDPWTPHARTPASDQASMLVTLLVEPSLLNPATSTEPDIVYRFAQRNARIDDAMRAHLDSLIALMFDEPMANLGTIQTKIEQLIDAVRQRFPFLPRSGNRRAIVDSRVRRAFESLRSSAIQGVKIEALAAGSGMSRSHFFRQFKRSIGVSPQHVIDEERVNYAVKALGSSGIMLSKLSEELGFSAPAHFTRFFVQHLGCTPSQFRRGLLIL